MTTRTSSTGTEEENLYVDKRRSERVYRKIRLNG